MGTSLAAVDSCTRKLRGCLPLIDDGIEMTRQVATDCEETPAGRELVSELREVMLKYARLQREMSQCCEGAREALLDMSSNQDNAATDIVSLYTKKVELAQKTNNDGELLDFKHVKEFIETVWTLHRSADDDEAGEENEIKMTAVNSHRFLCPITKLEFREPVKSTVCGHTYSRLAIVAHISQVRWKARCPVAGCVHFVTLEELEPDNVMVFEMKKRDR